MRHHQQTPSTPSSTTFPRLTAITWLTCVLALAGMTFTASATTLLRLSPEELLERSSVVISATIVDTIVWKDPHSNVIRTDLILDDVDILWANDPDFVPTVLTYTGGELDGRGVAVAGMPSWPLSQRAVFFVEGDGQSQICPTVGWHQGLFLATGPDGALENPSGDGLAVGPQGVLLEGAFAPTHLTLQQLQLTLAQRRAAR